MSTDNPAECGTNRSATRRGIIWVMLLGMGALAATAAGVFNRSVETEVPVAPARADKISRTDREWRALLTAEQYEVTRRKATEPPFTGDWNNKRDGVYECVCCGLPLFRSDTKFDSGTGWPSFFAPISESDVASIPDDSLFMRRIEVLCSRCDAHLGHAFDDGPPPTGLRYCINSAALRFSEAQP